MKNIEINTEDWSSYFGTAIAESGERLCTAVNPSPVMAAHKISPYTLNDTELSVVQDWLELRAMAQSAPQILDEIKNFGPPGKRGWLNGSEEQRLRLAAEYRSAAARIGHNMRIEWKDGLVI